MGNLNWKTICLNYLQTRALITKLRCCNLKIPVETGRWVNIPREERICHLCHNDIGSEYHYIFECSFPNVIFDLIWFDLVNLESIYKSSDIVFDCLLVISIIVFLYYMLLFVLYVIVCIPLVTHVLCQRVIKSLKVCKRGNVVNEVAHVILLHSECYTVS